MFLQRMRRLFVLFSKAGQRSTDTEVEVEVEREREREREGEREIEIEIERDWERLREIKGD